MEVVQLLESLNDAQREAVLHDGGPLLVIAGAGSGKTRVLTHRIAHLVDARGISPFEILAITFTNKAAGEMRHRVGALVGPVAERMWVSTFHSACVRILRRDGARLGFPAQFTIYDQADAVRLVSYVVRDLAFDPKKLPPRSVHATISNAKNRGLSPGAFAAEAQVDFERKIAEVYVEYQARLLRAAAMDFDDLLMKTVELFEGNPEVLSTYQQRFRHVLVDEYQDTNPVQNRMVTLLGAEHRNVCVVGDGDQSIYAFRGADVTNILEFERAFPDATVVVLDQNYRSTRTILDAANAVIANNTSRKPKDLWSDGDTGALIVRYHAADEADEARWVTGEIGRMRDAAEHRFAEIAVFYRTNAQSRVLEEHFMRAGLPYRVVGGTRFYDRREVKDAVAYLRAVVNPDDEVSLKRILNVPKRGIGDTSVAKLDAYAAEHRIGFRDALGAYGAAGVSGRAASGLAGFNSMLADLEALIRPPADEGRLPLDGTGPDLDAPTGAVGHGQGPIGPARMLDEVLSRSGYRDELTAERSIEAEGRLENLAELVGMAEEFASLDEFLEQMSLVSDVDAIDPEESAVVLMTLHAAKGLEYPVVFLVGMEDGIFPSQRTLLEPAQIEEERRLAYVGITRARERLFVSAATARMLHGTTQYNPPSRFLAEIPEVLIEERGTPRRRGGLRRGTSWNDRAHRSDTDTDGRVFGAGGGRPSVPAPPRPTGANELDFKVGDGLVHSQWGDGVILDLRGGGDDLQATVRFTDGREKVLLLKWAPVRRAPA
ncbi:MAG: UvrD-helicase domain-containing protein [Microthrixaceae bacterium]